MSEFFELKNKLEKKVKELETELGDIKLLLKVLNMFLEEKRKEEEEMRGEERETINLTSKEGAPLGKLILFEKEARLVVEEEIKFDRSLPPFKTFFIGRILEGWKQSQGIDYEIREENGKVKEVLIKNIDTENKKLIRELINTATWTLSRARERVGEGV